MSPSDSTRQLWLAITSASVGISALAACYWLKRGTTSVSTNATSEIRRKLPPNLDDWRCPGNNHEAEEAIWQDLPAFFAARGYKFWMYVHGSVLAAPMEEDPMSCGFSYATPLRGIRNVVGGVERLCVYEYRNPLSRAAFDSCGHDVVIRVVSVGGEGETHLRILRKLATGPRSLLSSNHTLPMLDEIHLEDIAFGVFPKAGGTLRELYGYWAKNSAGDILYMLIQALEALAFIHGLGIAHRDAFRDNFLVQWQPESLSAGTVSPSQPRVYLIDFEVAVDFPPDCREEDRVCTGYPLGGSFSQPEMYARPIPPEMASGKPYNPFKLDVWQLGESIADFKSTIPEIDEILASMTNPDPVSRPTASEALERLSAAVYALPPTRLLIPPVFNSV